MRPAKVEKRPSDAEYEQDGAKAHMQQFQSGQQQ